MRVSMTLKIVRQHESGDVATEALAYNYLNESWHKTLRMWMPFRVHRLLVDAIKNAVKDALSKCHS